MSSEKIKKSPGRPKKLIKKSSRIEIKATEKLKQELTDLAEQRGLSVSSFITMALNEYINKPENRNLTKP